MNNLSKNLISIAVGLFVSSLVGFFATDIHKSSSVAGVMGGLVGFNTFYGIPIWVIVGIAFNKIFFDKKK